MARGKKAAQAASRRASAVSDALGDARREVAELKARMTALEAHHRAEMQRRALGHMAHLDALVDERYGQVLAGQVAAKVEEGVRRREREVRLEIAAAVADLFNDGGLIGFHRSGNVSKAMAIVASAIGVKTSEFSSAYFKDFDRSQRRLTERTLNVISEIKAFEARGVGPVSAR